MGLLGGPVLVRTKPLRATPLGKELLAHIQKVSVLEEALNIQSGLEAQAAPISVAVNNDVLATWFSQVMAAFSSARDNPVHIVNADQTQTSNFKPQISNQKSQTSNSNPKPQISHLKIQD